MEIVLILPWMEGIFNLIDIYINEQDNTTTRTTSTI